MVKLENFKKFLPGDTRRDVTLKDVYNKVENGKLELVGVYPHKYWGVMNGSTRVRCDDYPIYRYSDLLLMLAEAKVLLGEDPATEINRVRRRAFGDAYDASTVGFPIRKSISVRRMLSCRNVCLNLCWKVNDGMT